jgi:putative tricarboxylic transport membrane protein
VIGSYAIRNNLFDVVIMLAFGVIGFFFERRKFPVAPFVLAFVLGSIIENEFRRSIQMTTTSLWDTFSSPIAIVLIVFNVIFLISPYIGEIRKRLKMNMLKGR